MNKQQKNDAYDCEVKSMLGESKECVSCSCSVCLAQQPKIFTPNDYEAAAMVTANKDLNNDEKLLNATLGILGEGGEISDMIKKSMFQGHTLDHDHVKKELGDVCWYLALAAEALETDLETIMKMNMDKLKKRYPEGFEAERSLNRSEGDI
jgi:NTP pyrophosphatase (non-canonical NTP hydrolase)